MSKALGGVVLVVAVFAGCTDTEFVNRPFNPPVDAANGYLGYFTTADQQTTCGNCHNGRHRDWAQTGHAHAFGEVENSGSAQGFCYTCHTVGSQGNPGGGTGGWETTQNPIYQDVQCENCHGPGLEHVENTEAVSPQASILADTGTNGTCGDCHQGDHHPFVEQWAQSRHGTVPAQSITSGSAYCQSCHEGGTALEVKFLEFDDYIEKGTEIAITCAVCHDPHGSPFEGQLRASLSADAGIDNLCVTCHARTGTPPSSRGPHAAQGLLVLGMNVGWIPPGFVYDSTLIQTSHGTTANEKLCATCHVSRFTVTDEATGDFTFEAVGHTFDAIPCVDADGLPVTGPCASAERSYTGCTTGACHLGPGNEGAVQVAYDNLVLSMDNFLDDVWEDTNGDRVIDPFPTDAGVLPRVVVRGDTLDLDVRDDSVTVAEGALWNAQLAFTSSRTQFSNGVVYRGIANGGNGIAFSAHKSSGNGVHNSFLLKALLIASIDAVQDEYGVTLPVARQEQLERARALLPKIFQRSIR